MVKVAMMITLNHRSLFIKIYEKWGGVILNYFLTIFDTRGRQYDK